jgi:hypothetical protein
MGYALERQLKVHFDRFCPARVCIKLGGKDSAFFFKKTKKKQKN